MDRAERCGRPGGVRAGHGLGAVEDRTAGAAALAEKPELAGTVVILVAIPETMVILGFIVAVMLVLRGGGG